MKLIYIVLIIITAIVVSYSFITMKGNDSAGSETAAENMDARYEPAIGEIYETAAADLDIPWEIVFLPDGRMMVTERSGGLLVLGETKETVAKIEGVSHTGEGGLLGLVLHPDFIQNGYLYLYLTTSDSDEITNQVERYKFAEGKLSERKIIIDGIKGSINHDGGRIAFGPDGYLYITTGDAQSADLAQDKNSLNGKILRIGDDGNIPSDNPFGNAVYSFGHRNPQGITWDDNGILWETEHGPSGFESGFDEINIIEKGGNYGWPILTGDQEREGFVSPINQSGPSDTWAPAGLTYSDGKLYFGGLRGEALYVAEIEGEQIKSFNPYFKNMFGRIRAVTLGPDGNLYFSTSNRDGRGIRQNNDDKIIKIDPELIN